MFNPKRYEKIFVAGCEFLCQSCQNTKLNTRLAEMAISSPFCQPANATELSECWRQGNLLNPQAREKLCDFPLKLP